MDAQTVDSFLRIRIIVYQKKKKKTGMTCMKMIRLIPDTEISSSKFFSQWQIGCRPVYPVSTMAADPDLHSI